MPSPDSLIDNTTHSFMSHFLVLSSCLYFARYRIVSSTEIPNAILKTRSVEGFKGMPNQPMKPAVKIIGIIFGIIEINTILQDLNNKAISIEIITMADIMFDVKLLNK